jgi:hypothetical protein
MQIKTITFGQAEIRSADADDPRTIRHSSADDLPLVCRRNPDIIIMADGGRL